MADLEHARSMLRMAHKDFNALVGMQANEPIDRAAEVENVRELLAHVKQMIAA